MASVQLSKIGIILISLILCLLLSANTQLESRVVIFGIAQDNVKYNSGTAIQDSAKISKDSLEKFIPYLDDVEADSKNELLILYMLTIILATLFSEDLACIGAGIMAANELIGFWPASIAAISGIFIFDFTLYFSGRFLGSSIFNIAPFKWVIHKDSIERSVEWFKHKGPIMLIASRFIPGSRIPIYVSAGILKTGFWRFLIYFGVTTIIWTPIFVWISVFAGNEILTYYEAYDDYALWIILGTILFLWALYRYITPLFTKRGRRILIQRIRNFFK